MAKTYSASIVIDGRQIVERASSKTAAQRALNDRIRNMLEQKSRASSITMEEYAKKWVEIYVTPRVRGPEQKKKKGTISQKQARWYTAKIEKYILPVFGTRPLSELTKTELQSSINKASTEYGLAEKTSKDIITVLNSILAQAVEDGIISRNPAKGLQKHGREAVPRRALTQHEQELIMGYKGENRDAPMFQLMLKTGGRDSEICALTVQNVDLSTGVISFEWGIESGTQRKRDYTKSNAGNRKVPIQACIRPMLERHIRGKQPEEFVFTNENGDQLTVTEFIRRWKVFWRCVDIDEGAETTAHGHVYDPEDDLDSNGVPLYPDENGQPRNGHKVDPHLTPYNLRHTFATELARAGVQAHVRSAIMGHKDIVTTQGYTHYDAWDIAEAGKLLDRAAMTFNNTADKEK